MRQEKDFLGTKEIPSEALYGIHSLRAKENFPQQMSFPLMWYKAMGKVKNSAYLVAEKFFVAVNQKYNQSLPIKEPSREVLVKLQGTAAEVSKGEYFEHFIIPAISGGAGTSINMNINEIIANATLLKMGHNAGDYIHIDPVEHANIFQSTNDVVPTALKIAAMELLQNLEDGINALRIEMEKQEKAHRDTLRIGYTQMQQAVPSSYGRLFSTYNEALSRDWWRVSKCFERIKVVNMGGSAIGTGITVPTYYMVEIIQQLQVLTGLPITRSENLSDATCNLDSLVEVHAILKSHAVNLEKMVSDLRLLSSDLLQSPEVSIPKMQAGSSIMPAKVNPVIPEYVISVAHKVYANDMLISSLSAQGCLDLNAYIPAIGTALIESIEMLIAAGKTIRQNLITGMVIQSELATEKLYKSGSITTALLPYLGYNQATELALFMKKKSCSVFEANTQLGFLEDEKLKDILSPGNLLKEGFSVKDILSN